jgi:hypothetical protein
MNLPSRPLLRTLAFFVIATAFAHAQAGTEPPARNTLPPASSSTVNLNDSENARKARALLDQTIQSLGGDAYLNYENREEEGRYYPLYHGRTDSTGIAYRYYVEYPEKDRFEVLKLKDIHIIPGMIDIGGVKSDKIDVTIIHNGDKGYEVSYKGTALQDKTELQNYLRRRRHSVEWVFRKWMRDPSVALFYSGVSIVDGKETEHVTLLNSTDDSVEVYLEENSHFPIKISYSWRDPKDRQKNTEEEVYDGYKLVQGIWTPHSITRYFNGETSQQRFVSTASYNVKLTDSMFDASVTYDPYTPIKKK